MLQIKANFCFDRLWPGSDRLQLTVYVFWVKRWENVWFNGMLDLFYSKFTIARTLVYQGN